MYFENLKKFIRYFGKKRKLKLLIFILMAFLAGIFEFLGVALIYPFIINMVNPTLGTFSPITSKIPFLASWSNTKIALVLGISALLLFVIKNLYMVLFLFVQSKFIQKWNVSINNLFVQYFMYAPYKDVLKIPNSEKLYVIRTLSSQATNGFLFRVMALVTNSAIVVLILGLILWKFTLAGVISLGFISVCLLVQNFFFRKKSKKLGVKVQEFTKTMNSCEYKTVINIKDTKILCNETNSYNEYAMSANKLANMNTLQTFYAGIPPYLIETLSVITLLLLGTIVAIQNINQNSAMIASFAMIVASLARIAPALNRIQSVLINLPAGLNFVKNLNEVYEKYGIDKLKIRNDLDDKILPFHNRISLHNIDFSYDEQKPILKNISFEIEKNDFIGIIGLSGAGKSTLADIIIGLLAPNSGEIVVDNTKLTEKNHHSFRRNIGYVPQDLQVLETSFRENVAWGIEPNEIDDNRVEYLLKQVHLEDVVKSFDNGIYAKPFVDENGLSRGQKQRLAIARALYRDPEILIFDEATSALDLKVENEIMDMLQNVGKNKTIIAIAHRLSTLKACNKLIYLKEGRLIDVGKFEDLSSKYPEFAELVRLSSIEK